MRKTKKFLAGMLAVFLTTSGIGSGGITAKADSCGGLAEEDVYTPGADEVIKDPLLHWAIRSSMNAIKSNVKLTADMVGDKSVRYISFELCSHAEDFADWTKPYWIENLEGIQYAKSATMVDIGYTSAVEGKSIQDVSPLSELTQLDTLILKQDGITDVSPLKTLTNLSELDLSMNGAIKDVSAIKSMKKLTTLNVSSNAIENVDDIADLTKLQYLNISGNKISSLPDMSKLTELRTLLASGNELTDVSAIGQLKNLEALDLTKNSGLTDVKALAGLTHLDEERTYMPTAEMKTDLFAAINVNKIFDLFNISRMTTADIDNVQKAIDAYDALSDEQKTYIDSARLEAAKNNKAKVEAGEEPDYYPEYDNGGTKQPVLDRLEIKVVDKKGNPLPDVNFVRKRVNTGATPSEYTIATDKNGVLTLKHTSVDAWFDNIIIEVDNTGDKKYVSEPERLEYTVSASMKTETLNGKAATGLEELQFVLIPEDEYVDKTELETALKNAEKVEEEYKYTEDTYQIYAEALAKAQEVFADADASEADVKNAAEALQTAIDGLKVADKLTTLKVIVKDANGNLFTRPFKFQYTSDKGGYNAYSDAHTGVLYLPASAAWEDGETWKLFPCHQELYSANPVINFTVGKENGKSYFKEINGEEVGADYEKEIIVTWTGKETPGFEPITPDNTVLKEVIEQMKGYASDGYTPASFEVLTQTISKAEKIADQADAAQEDFNAAVAELKNAAAGLKLIANKTALAKEISYKTSYNQTNYTSASWSQYANALAMAEDVNANADATQEQVDAALQILQNAEKQLKWRADNSELKETLNKAKALNEEDYESGWDALQNAIAKAEDVIADADATEATINSAKEDLETAIDGLVKKPVEVDYSCYPGTFKAKVMDEEGNPLKGIKFNAIIDGALDNYPITSDNNGIITYYVSGTYNAGKTTHIVLADTTEYVTEDEHYFTASGSGWVGTMDTIDGNPYAEGTKLTYTLKKKSGGDTPTPGEQILSDAKTFRAKVVDEDGNAVDGIEFEFTPDDEYADEYTEESANGVLEHKISAYDYMLTYTVKLADGQKDTDGKEWKCAETHTFKTDGTIVVAANIVEVDGKALAEAGEITFVLTKDGGDAPVQVDKAALKDAIEIAGLKKEKDYTADSWAEYQEAVQKATEILNKEDATQEEVDEQVALLKEAANNLVKAEKPIVTDKNAIRIKVVDESGKLTNEMITFKAIPDIGYPFNLYTGEGVIEYPVSDGDSGTNLITVQLKDESIKIGDKEYVLNPEKHEFTLQSSSVGTFVTKVDGEDVGDGKEVVFTLTEKTAPVVDKDALQAKVDELKDMKQGDYTLNSYKNLKTALTEAETALDNPNATQQEVDGALSALKEAQNNLKTVQGMRTLTVAVTSEDGSQLPGNIKFIRDNVKYYVQTPMFANDGALIWQLNGYEDAGEYEIYLPEDSAYIATPAVMKITIGKEDGTSVVEKINGVPVAEAQANIKLLAKSKDACDKVTFRAQVQNENGEILSDIQFRVKNGDPNTLASDENGMIRYDITSWDIDTEMTVSLKENDKWSCDKQVTFKVADDAEAPGRGVISEIDGKAFTGGEKIIFVLVDKNKLPEVDKTTLIATIQEAQTFDKAIYTEETYSILENALSEAVRVAENADATQDVVDNAERVLRAAIDGLVVKEIPAQVDKTNLENAMKEAQALKKDDYTEASYKVLEDALKAALEVAENADATQEEVNNAEKVLRNAVSGLVSKEKPGEDKEHSGKNDPDKDNTKNPTTKTPSKDKTNQVQTGDAANIAMPIMGIGFAVLMFAVVILLRKRSRR